jgi:hypothetical protein
MRQNTFGMYCTGRSPSWYFPALGRFGRVTLAFHTAEASTLLMRFRPSSTLFANLIAFGSVEGFSVAHSQKDAINAALSAESFESVKPLSMMGINPAAARRRLSSGVAKGISFDISRLYRGAAQPDGLAIFNSRIFMA